MSGYPSPNALIADARLRLDKLGKRAGVLVVEGPSDRTVLKDRYVPAGQIIVAGSKSLVVGAHKLVGANPDSGLLFVVDCDYDVPAGELKGTSCLVITENADLEGDLVALGLMREVVLAILPDRFDDPEAIADDTVTTAATVAGAIGHVRRHCRLKGPKIGFKNLDYSRLLSVFERSGDSTAIYRLLTSQCTPAPDLGDIASCAGAQAKGIRVCNGHDVVALVGEVLKTRYRVQKRRLGNLEPMLGLALDERSFRRWAVATRLQRWQSRTGRTILALDLSA